jgi:soluble lytic murein transglycosylase-like protein
LDIKSLTEVLQLSLMNKIMDSDSSGTEATDNQSPDMFGMMLQELIQNSSTNNLGNDLQQAQNENTSIVTDNSNIVSNNSGGSIDSQIEGAVSEASQKYGVDPDFIKAIIKQESGFHPNSVSHAGAEGLMQLMPKTAESLGVKNPLDVLENVDGGTKYIKKLIDTFGGNKELALSAYNGGIGRMNNRGVDTVAELCF